MRVVHVNEHMHTVYVGRGSAYGNPFTHLSLSCTTALVQCHTVEEAVANFEAWARGATQWDTVIPPERRIRLLLAIKRLKCGDVLGCYCRRGAPCHGLVIHRLWQELGRQKQTSRHDKEQTT